MRMNAGERERERESRIASKRNVGREGGRGKRRGGQPERSSEFPFTSVDKTAEKPLLRGQYSRRRPSFTGSGEGD